jgi:flagellar motor switch protein FliG
MPQLGAEELAAMLRRVDFRTEGWIMDALHKASPSLAAEVRSHMFAFEDIVLLDDESIKQLLREVTVRELALALKGADPALLTRFYDNMSQCAAEELRDDISVVRPGRDFEIDVTRKSIAARVMRLAAIGRVTLPR